MFRAQFSHHQEILYVQQLVYFVWILCRLAASRVALGGPLQPCLQTADIVHTPNIQIVVYKVPPDNEQISD
jgi:hypothetical protein